MKQDHLLTEGNVFHALLAFSVPFLIANLIQALYGAVDLMVVGWHTVPLKVWRPYPLNSGDPDYYKSGVRPNDGRHNPGRKIYGMRDEEQTRRTIGTTLSVFAAVAVALTLVMLIFT